MYNISFHLKLYRIIYWTKKYSPKLRFHNKVVYKCKSLSKWWLWACKSTFYLIKKGRICGPCETKHDKPNRLAVHWLYGSSIQITQHLSSAQHSLFRKKRFEINFFVQRNASKFAIFIEKENPCSFFRFSFRATLSFTLWMPWSMST